MIRITLTLAILALAADAAQAGAQHSSHKPLRRHVAYHHRHPSRRLRLTAEMKDDGRRTPAVKQAALRQDDYLQPTVSRALGKGAYASFGYQSGVVRGLQPGELNGAADTRLRHPESTAGVKVGIPF